MIAPREEIELGSPRFLSVLARPSNPFNDTQPMVMPSFVNDTNQERLRRDSIFNIGRSPAAIRGSSIHSFTGLNKGQPEEEEKVPGDLKILQKIEQKESQV